jgi:leucyl aminopeptidase
LIAIDFSATPPPGSGTIVLPVGEDGALGPAAAELDQRTDGRLARAIEIAGGKLKGGATVDLTWPPGTEYDRVVLVGTGKADRPALELERAGGDLASSLEDLKVTRAALDLRDLELDAALALTAGAATRAYRFDRYRTEKEPDAATKVEALTVHHAAADEADERFGSAAARVEAVHAARDLVNEPANMLTPEAFAERCAGLRELGVKVEILDRAELERLGFRALLGVAQGSANPPFVAVMQWSGGPSEAAPIALVGKGVTFDTGGISIKPAAGMEDMKGDMAGAAAVYGVMRALAKRRAAANVVGLVGLVENMPSGTAQRPGDVVRSLAGLTIEVINTDAEGRLVLADVLAYAKERFKPASMIDLATLTGAVIVALGHEQAGLFATDDALADQLRKAGEEVGEPLWRLPLGDGYMKHIKSDIADIKNVGRSREAGSTAGAVFLQRFVGDVPWAHIDIAAMSKADREQTLCPKGATGFGVRLLDRWIATRVEAG